jgi:hypothetical protein
MMKSERVFSPNGTKRLKPASTRASITAIVVRSPTAFGCSISPGLPTYRLGRVPDGQNDFAYDSLAPE